jgi:hypothetical protein
MYVFSTGISETFPRLFATGSSSATTWKSHHLSNTSPSLEHLSLSLDQVLCLLKTLSPSKCQKIFYLHGLKILLLSAKSSHTN